MCAPKNSAAGTLEQVIQAQTQPGKALPTRRVRFVKQASGGYVIVEPKGFDDHVFCSYLEKFFGLGTYCINAGDFIEVELRPAELRRVETKVTTVKL